MSRSRRDDGPSDVAGRVEDLRLAVEHGRGRLDPQVVARADDVLGRAGRRLALSGDHTVAALAGATGSGKSSLLNALAGAHVAQPGVTRPTTGRPLAVVVPVQGAEDDPRGREPHVLPASGRPGVRRASSDDRHGVRRWGRGRVRSQRSTDGTGAGPDASVGAGSHGAGPDALLDWLQVEDRRIVPRRSTDPDATAESDLALATGLVLLDLPDHDSVVTEHRAVAERLYARVDLLVWVVDPQKYADAALHVRYLRPLAAHASVVVLVLNQVDRLTPDEAAACLADLARLAAQDGLVGAPVLGVSAATGQGVAELRGLLADAARGRRAALDRVTADVRDSARDVLAACGPARPGGRPATGTTGLVDALEVAAGVPAVVEATRRSAVLRSRSATGWPPTRWLARLRADPLRRLGLGRRPTSSGGSGTSSGRSDRTGSGRTGSDPTGSAAGRTGSDPTGSAAGRTADVRRSSMPRAGAPESARAALAVRDYVDAATSGAPDAWVLDARAAVDPVALVDALDRAVVAVDAGAGPDPRWWRAVGAVQWLVLGVALAGLLWLGVLAGLAYLRLPEPVTPVWHGVPWPTVLLVGGVLLGLLVALVSRVAAGVGARRRAAVVRRRLRAAVAAAAGEQVVEPVGRGLTAWAACREAAARAAR